MGVNTSPKVTWRRNNIEQELDTFVGEKENVGVAFRLDYKEPTIYGKLIQKVWSFPAKKCVSHEGIWCNSIACRQNNVVVE